LKKMRVNKKSLARTFFSIIILFAYFSLNAGFATGLVLCTRSDGHISFKFISCESCCSHDLSHASEALSDIGRNTGDLDTEDSCCPCSDIPVSSYISQFCSRFSRDTDASWVFLANTPRLISIPKKADRAFKGLQKFTYNNQISSLLKFAVLLN
jgi:hypothetical protein